jgi:hypothetical protein
MSLFLQIDPNPNCDPLDGMIFQPKTAGRPVAQLRYERAGVAAWCDVTAVEEGGQWRPAEACLIDDSGDGACYLVYGGAWGLRLKDASEPAPWDLARPDQWGAGYLLLGGDGADVRFL